MIFYFDAAQWARMVRLAAREKDAKRKRRLLTTLLGVVPAVSTFHAICFFLDGILFPRLHSVDVRTPVFVVGHARSGTTLVHRLMALDDRFSSFLLYQLYFPSVLQKKALRGLAAFDKRFLGGRLDRRVRAYDERKYAKVQRMHPMSLFSPEEDDFIFTYSAASGGWIVKLPYMGELDFYYVDERPERSRRRMMNFYRECVKRQLYLNGRDRIHLSKNPIFAGRVRTLIETFHGARIVVPLRNPYETIPSLLKLLRSGWKYMGWAQERIDRSLRALADQSFHTYTHPLEVLAEHPEVPHAVIDYRDLVAEPKKTIEKAYADLGFEMTPELSAALDEEQTKARGYKPTHRYTLDEFGLDAAEIRARLADLFERFGWDGKRAAVGSSTTDEQSVDTSVDTSFDNSLGDLPGPTREDSGTR